MKYDVFSIGTALVDYFAEVDDSFLRSNKLAKGATNFLEEEKMAGLQGKIGGKIIASMPGDNGRNVCEGVCFLGGKAAYAGNVGDDEDGDFFIEELNARGMTNFVNVEDGTTGRIIAFITPDKQRTFAANLGNGVEYSGLEEEAILDSGFLFLTSITLLCEGETGESALNALEFAKKNNVKVALSIESPPMIEENVEELIEIISRDASVLFANEEETKALMGGIREFELRKLAACAPIFCFKMGENGSLVFSEGQTHKIPAIQTQVVDTTGAGDFYAAGFLKGLMEEKSLMESGTIGAQLASKAISRFGASLKS